MLDRDGVANVTHAVANPTDAIAHTSTARSPPGLIHRKPPCLALGEAQYSNANIWLTSTRSTGHFA